MLYFQVAEITFKGLSRSFKMSPFDKLDVIYLVSTCLYVPNFYHFRDTARLSPKIANFLYPTCNRRPCWKSFNWNFTKNFCERKLKSLQAHLWSPCFWLRDNCWMHFDKVSACIGRKNGHKQAYTALYSVSRVMPQRDCIPLFVLQ